MTHGPEGLFAFGEGGSKARDEVDPGTHFNDLYDENEDRSGERVDLATGKRIDNSSPSAAIDKLDRIVAPPEGNSEDALGALPKEDDAAARWLREHGGEAA